MENFQGDLTDIFRASTTEDHQPSSSSSSVVVVPQSNDHHQLSNWEFPIISDHLNLSSHFGDPFCNMRDPLLLHHHHHQLDVVSASPVTGSCYFSSSSPPNSAADHHVLNQVRAISSPVISGANSTTVNNKNIIIGDQEKVVFELHDEINKSSPCDVFSRIQISHNNPNSDSPVLVAAATSSSTSPLPPAARAFKGAASNYMVSIDMNINTNTSKSCLIDNTGSLQISSPRNLGIKRRKSQAKKVVCIPAPAAVNSRPSGEVVPSDLWAWRKYGQKPIKGSPYPRGYYRCSSSKGCSARKQVERSRTDPNMLVITYTSEHNHPWPTQRNALAGSTRSQPPKTTNNATASSRTTQQLHHHHHHHKAKEEQHNKESSNDTNSSSPPDDHHPAIMPSINAAVKEENVDDDFDNKQMETIHDQFHHNINSYRPSLPADSTSHNQSEDFFADLGEIEADPLHLLFSSTSTQAVPDHKQISKGLDPFNLFDWSGSDENNNNISIGQEEKSPTFVLEYWWMGQKAEEQKLCNS